MLTSNVLHQVVSEADQKSLSISSLTKDRKFLLLEATARKLRMGISMEQALYEVEPTAEYVPVEIECLIFDHEERDQTALLGLFMATLLSF